MDDDQFQIFPLGSLSSEENHSPVPPSKREQSLPRRTFRSAHEANETPTLEPTFSDTRQTSGQPLQSPQTSATRMASRTQQKSKLSSTRMASRTPLPTNTQTSSIGKSTNNLRPNSSGGVPKVSPRGRQPFQSMLLSQSLVFRHCFLPFLNPPCFGIFNQYNNF